MASFDSKIVDLISLAVASMRDGFSVVKLGQVIQAFMADAMRTAAESLANEGHEKKQLVLDSIGKLIDALPLPWWLMIIRMPLKSIIITIADGAIEAIYERFKDSINGETTNG